VGDNKAESTSFRQNISNTSKIVKCCDHKSDSCKKRCSRHFLSIKTNYFQNFQNLELALSELYYLKFSSKLIDTNLRAAQQSKKRDLF